MVPSAGCFLLMMGLFATSDADLGFSVTEGQSSNHFIRQHGVSAHMNLQTQPLPRLVIAFPAGNSGAALFFEELDEAQVWGAVEDIQVIQRRDKAGRTLYGVQADITIEAEALSLEEADTGSVRFLRKAVDYSELPARGPPDVSVAGQQVRFSRERPDGQSSYLLTVDVLAGELQTGEGIRFVSNRDGALKIRVSAASGDPLEAPVPGDRLLTDNVASNEVLARSLAFLTYDSKLLAGSWRFLTYFGRDTLLSVRLLMPALRPETAEIGLGSVFERINDRGEVAHEEEIGELAVYRNLAHRDTATADPIYDYAMVDDNLMLAPVFNAYVEHFGIERAAGFVADESSSSVPYAKALVRNLEFVVQQARAFADEAAPANLIAIKKGLNVGNWRDSQEGLVGGRYPYDVNAVLMPAALSAAADIVGSGLLDDYGSSLPEQRELRRMADVWEANARSYFKVSVDSKQARARMSVYARKNNYPSTDIPDSGITFHAVSLDAGFEPIPVMHSDTGMDLLFLQPPEPLLAEIVSNMTRSFPVGLSTPVGVLAANPAFADAEAQALVTGNNYHGTVVWSWQQAMMIAGIDRQLRRNGLSRAMRERLLTARRKIWAGIMASKEIINSELWSIALRGDDFVIAPFGQSEGHLTESNAVQLWSTVFLAFRPDAVSP